MLDAVAHHGNSDGSLEALDAILQHRELIQRRLWQHVWAD